VFVTPYRALSPRPDWCKMTPRVALAQASVTLTSSPLISSALTVVV
jgi:hypothetical protein